jgi:hypothetical protein
MKGLFALLAATILALFMVACGGNGEGPELGDFPAITKGVEDEPFTLTPPSSRSPAPFTLTSSKPEIASIDGTTVTIHAVGTTTITASQPSVGSYGPTQKSTTLKVTAGKSPTTTCVSPAVRKENMCVVEATVATVKTESPALTWTTATQQVTWANALSFCMDSKINDQVGWSLPTVDQLKSLYASGALKGQTWTLGTTWSSVKGASASVSERMAVDLSANTGTSGALAETATAYVTCVK